MFKVFRKLNFQKHTHRFFSNFAKVNCLKYSISQSKSIIHLTLNYLKAKFSANISEEN